MNIHLEWQLFHPVMVYLFVDIDVLCFLLNFLQDSYDLGGLHLANARLCLRTPDYGSNLPGKKTSDIFQYLSEIFWIRDLNLQGNLIEDVKDLAWLNSLDELESIVLFNNNVLLDKINEFHLKSC